MTTKQLQKLEAALQKRGYRKWTRCLTSRESWAWFKTFDKAVDADGETIAGYQIAFRVWDYTRHGQKGENSYGFDFWASPINTDGRIDLTANWEPICNFDTFEVMANDFYNMTKQYTKQ